MNKHKTLFLTGALIVMAYFLTTSCTREYTRDASIVAVFKGTNNTTPYSNQEVQGLYETYDHYFVADAGNYFTAKIAGTTVLFHVDSGRPTTIPTLIIPPTMITKVGGLMKPISNLEPYSPVWISMLPMELGTKAKPKSKGDSFWEVSKSAVMKRNMIS